MRADTSRAATRGLGRQHQIEHPSAVIVAGGTSHTASSSLPLMRRNPICNASPNLSSGRRRSSISLASPAENWKNTSTSKAVNSRGRCRRPRNVACQLSMVPSLNVARYTRTKHDRQVVESTIRIDIVLCNYGKKLPYVIAPKMRGHQDTVAIVKQVFILILRSDDPTQLLQVQAESFGKTASNPSMARLSLTEGGAPRSR